MASQVVQPVQVDDVHVISKRRKSIVDLIHATFLPNPIDDRTSTFQDKFNSFNDDTKEKHRHSITPRSTIVSNYIMQLQLDVVVRKSKINSLEGDSSSIDELRLEDIKSRVGDWLLDDLYRKKNIRILLNAMFGLGLAMFELYVTWINKIIVDENNNVIEILNVPTSKLSNWLKIAMTCFSFLLVLQIIDLYSLTFSEKYQYEKTFENETKHLQTILNIQNINIKKPWYRRIRSIIIKYTTSSMTWSCFIEIIIVFIHPPPYVDSVVHLTASCLMFFRFYLIARVYRDYSKVYRQRRDILLNCFLHSTNPTFNWFLSIKIDFAKSPIQFIFILFFCVWCILTISIHIFEREYQPLAFTLPDSAWYTFCTLTTHGLAHMAAASVHGRFVTSVTMLWGVTLETMIVVAILHNFSLNDNGRMVSVYLQRMSAQAQLEKVAAYSIRTWWKWKQARHKKSITVEYRRRATFWHALERLGPVRNKQLLLEQNEGSPVVEKLQILEESVERLTKCLKKQLKQCLCRRWTTPEENKAREAQLARIRETQEEIDEQSKTISFLLARVMQLNASTQSFHV